MSRLIPADAVLQVRAGRTEVLALLPGAGAIALLAFILSRSDRSVSLSELGALFAMVAVTSGLIALVQPRFPLNAALVYVGSPISFFIVFRHTSSAFAYPTARDLSIDAALTVGLLAGSVIPQGTRARFSLREKHDSLLLPMAGLLAAWMITGLVGIVRGNPLRYVVTDLIPVTEIVLAYLAASRLYPRKSQVRTLALVATSSLALTALIRLGFYPFGTRGFGVTQQGIGSHLVPRFFLVQPFAWLAPLCAVYGLTARTKRGRLAGGAFALLFGTCTLLSFERGTWALFGCAILPVVVVVLWRRPRIALAAGGVVALGTIALLVAGKGSYNPVVLIAHRLAYTRTQVFDPNEPLQNKRSDEARAIAREIRDHPAHWPIGAGLGATYIGPTGFRNIGYQQSFRRKHYSFNAYLAIALRSGLLGLAALVFLIASMVRVAWRSARSRVMPSLRLAGSVVFGGTVALVGISLVDPEILIHPLSLYLGATFGILTSALGWRESNASSEP